MNSRWASAIIKMDSKRTCMTATVLSEQSVWHQISVRPALAAGKEKTSQLKIFLKEAKEFGDKLQAKYGLFPEGTIDEDLKRLREGTL